MNISAGKRWVLAGAMMAALTTAEISVARAAPIPVAPETVILPDSGMTDIHYRRRYGAGRAFGGAALGILALGAAAAFANGNGYDDTPTMTGAIAAAIIRPTATAGIIRPTAMAAIIKPTPTADTACTAVDITATATIPIMAATGAIPTAGAIAAGLAATGNVRSFASMAELTQQGARSPSGTGAKVGSNQSGYSRSPCSPLITFRSSSVSLPHCCSAVFPLRQLLLSAAYSAGLGSPGRLSADFLLSCDATSASRPSALPMPLATPNAFTARPIISLE